MNKSWEYCKIDEKEVEKISKEYEISNILARILVKKNLVNSKDIEKFLNPTRQSFYDPYLMPDMDKAVDRIIKAIEKKEKIVIFGDYDVDGITSVTVLKSFLEDRNIDVNFYIPNRLEEGYGLNKKAIEYLAEEKNNLLITVDCGIAGVEEVEYAKTLGLDVIVTDHHEAPDIIPNAIAVIDAKRKDSTYPFRELAGVGVSFKLIQALSIKLNLDDKEYLKYLDIVCIGTISDIVPLVDENRVITKLGLKLVNQTKNIGLKQLIIESGYENVNSFAVSFGLSPRINACGRMGNAILALELFLTKDEEKAKEIAIKLNEFNKQRQQIEKRMFDEAVEKIEKEDKNNKVIVLSSNNWHHGIIGIVSSKITDMYFKPSILICEENDNNIAKGSGRSVPGFDLFEALNNVKDDIYKFGGHSMAIGISIEKEKIEKFKKDFEKYALNTNISDIIPVINIDEEISLKDINIESVKELDLLEPFGEQNSNPIFMIKNLKIDSIRSLSEGKHLKLLLKEDNFGIIDAIGFNLGYFADELRLGDKIDVCGNLEINEFNGRKNVQLRLLDLRKSY